MRIYVWLQLALGGEYRGAYQDNTGESRPIRAMPFPYVTLDSLISLAILAGGRLTRSCYPLYSSAVRLIKAVRSLATSYI